MNATGLEVASDAMDPADERLIDSQGIGGIIKSFRQRVAGGDLGNLPVVLGLIIISTVFQLSDPGFLAARNVVNITLAAVPYGIISLGIVVVLLLGEIDLSVGSISGLAASVCAVLVVNEGTSWPIGLAAGVIIGAVIGVAYGLVFTKIGVPSFVITLSGLLALAGAQLYVLGDQGTINVSRDSGLAKFTRDLFLGRTQSLLLVAAAAAVYLAAKLRTVSTRKRAGLSAPDSMLIALKAGMMLFGLGGLAIYLNSGKGRGLSYGVLLFIVLAVLLDLIIRRTKWGRHLMAVGGNVEAARRAGINTDRVYISAFALTGGLAALGGLMAMGRLTSVSQSAGSNDENLTAIAAAVIGGTSLFGGRGSAYSSLLGVLVLVSINNGLNLLSVDSSLRYVVTGGVLLLAVAIDSLARRARVSKGRA